MEKTKLIIIIILILIGASAILLLKSKNVQQSNNKQPNITSQSNKNSDNQLSLINMREETYPGSEIEIEETLDNTTTYHQYIASYQSQGLKIYALLTVPIGEKPNNGWPVIIFNHGYIPPEQYKTTQRYVTYVDYFARNGYIVFKSDYRGNGNSQGDPEGAYYSPAYAIDVLNAISSIKQFKDVDPGKIGMWGHSMGGNITLRDLEISQDIKAAVIWGGVVGSYDDLMNNWQRRVTYVPSAKELEHRNNNRQNLINQYGTPKSNPEFWNAIDPFYNISYINAPIQLNVGQNDEEVPVAFSESLYRQLTENGKTAELYTYPGADHNISGSAFSFAMSRSLAFFNKYLKEN